MAQTSQRPNRGKNFVNEEEIQCCQSVSTNFARPCGGQWATKGGVWEWVTIHYNSNWPFALNPKNERNV
jgi:hypothetical protein